MRRESIPAAILRHARGTGITRFHTAHRVGDDLRFKPTYAAHQWKETADPFGMDFF